MKKFILLLLVINTSLGTAFSQTYSAMPPGFNQAVRSLYFDTTSSLLYAGGNFTGFSDEIPVNYIAVWDGNQWDSLGSGVLGFVFSIVMWNGDIYAGGNLIGAGNTLSYGIARWDGNNWYTFGGINTAGLPNWGAVWHLNVINNELYVLGIYDSIGNILADGIAKFDGQSWHSFPPLDSNGYFNAVILYNNELYIGGNFDGGAGLADIAKFDGANWVSVGGGLSGPASSITDMKIFQNKLYVVGNLLTAQGDPGNGIAIWDGNSWSQAGSGLLPSTVQRIYEFQGELYAGGAIFNAGGVPVNCLAKWDGNNWHPTGGNFDNVVVDFASSGNDLFIGGAFWTVNNDSVYSIAKYHAPVSLPEAQHDKISIGPNPANHSIGIDFPERNEPVKLSIADLSGKIILTYENICLDNYELNISNFPVGMYILHLESKQLNYRKKLIFSTDY